MKIGHCSEADTKQITHCSEADRDSSKHMVLEDEAPKSSTESPKLEWCWEAALVVLVVASPCQYMEKHM